MTRDRNPYIDYEYPTYTYGDYLYKAGIIVK